MITTNRRPTDLTRYARELRTYRATLHDATGIVTGTCRELYYPGALWLEWRADAYLERFLVRRDDERLTLLDVVTYSSELEGKNDGNDSAYQWQTGTTHGPIS